MKPVSRGLMVKVRHGQFPAASLGTYRASFILPASLVTSAASSLSRPFHQLSLSLSKRAYLIIIILFTVLA
jgi:hypothetical protein